MATYSVWTHGDDYTTHKLIIKTTSKKKAMETCDGSSEPAMVWKFVKYNAPMHCVYYNQQFEETQRYTHNWAKEVFEHLGEW